MCFVCEVEFAFTHTHYALTSDVNCPSQVSRFTVSCRKQPFIICLEQHLLDAVKLTKSKHVSSPIFKSEVLIKRVINIHFHIILNSFLLHSNPQKQNTYALIKSYSHSIHWLFSMGFLSVSSIRPIKTMNDDNSYEDGSGQGFFSWRGYEKRSHAAELVISLPFFSEKFQQFNWTLNKP